MNRFSSKIPIYSDGFNIFMKFFFYIDFDPNFISNFKESTAESDVRSGFASKAKFACIYDFTPKVERNTIRGLGLTAAISLIKTGLLFAELQLFSLHG